MECNAAMGILAPERISEEPYYVASEKLSWNKALQTFLEQNPGLKTINDPEKLEYFRNDLNVDLPPLIRDLMLKSLPDLVLQPTTEEHLIDIFALAREQKIPVTVRGAGTWGYGGAVPTRGGILIDLGFMDTIEVNPANQQLTVGPGARFLDIHRELDRHGLTLLSMTSGKGGTLIGWMATGGMGFGTFSHGSVRSQLVSLRVITPQGEVKDLSAEDPEIGILPLHRRPDGHHRQSDTQGRPAARSVVPVCHPLRKNQRRLCLCRRAGTPSFDQAGRPHRLPFRTRPGSEVAIQRKDFPSR